MVAWARRGPRDIGGTTASALQRFEQTGNTWGGNAGDSSAANGSLMRCIPTALVRANDPKLRRDETREISSITHAERRTVDACVAYNEMVSALVNGAEPSQAVDEALRVCKEENLDPRVEVAIRQGRRIDLEASEQLNEWVFRGREPVTDWHDGGGYVLDSLAIGVAAVEDPRGPEAALISVVNMGGDADTNGAIAGGLLGAAYGESALPERWTECLQFGEEFRRAGDAITDGRFLPEDDDAVRSAAAEVETAADRTVPTGEYVRAAHDRVDPRTGRTVRVRSHRVQRRSGC